MRYINLDISIDRKTPDGYPVRADSDVSGQARGLLGTDPGDAQLLQALEMLNRRDTDRGALADMGAFLFETLFTGRVEALFQQSYGRITADDEAGLRIRLRIDPPEISILPWELIFTDTAGGFLSASRRTSLVRYIETTRPVGNLEVTFPLRMLVVMPDSVEPYPQLDAAVERRHLEQALDPFGDNVEAVFLEGNVTYRKISDALTEAPFHCLHFIGHGEFENETGFVLLNTPDGQIDPVDDARFADLFRNHPSMKLVVLNACKGAQVSRVHPFSGMAPNLVNRDIPAVVAMRYPIMDEAAVLFAREFYLKLFTGWDTGRVDVAIAHARNRLAGEFPDQREICTPVLFLRAKNGVLFDKSAAGGFKNIPLTRKGRDAVREVRQTYEDNLAMLGRSDDKAGLERQIRLMTLGKYAQISAAAAIVVLFLFSWVNLFDVLNLDTWAETLIVSASNPFKNRTFSKEIAVIGIDDPLFGKAWRGTKHPAMIEHLSEAGAKTLVFDLWFDTPTAHDERFSQAVGQAIKNGTRVVVGIQTLDKGLPMIIPELKEKGVDYGILCMGRKLKRTFSFPLALFKSGVDQNKPENAPAWTGEYYSLALTAYAAHQGLKIQGAQEDLMSVGLVSDHHSPQTVHAAKIRKIRSKEGCMIYTPGDRVADRILDPYPMSVIRDKSRWFSYQDVLAMPPEKTKILFENKLVLIGIRNKNDQREEIRGFSRKNRYGVEFHAEAINTLMSKVVVRPLGAAGRILFMVFMSCSAALIRSKLFARPFWWTIAAVLAVHIVYSACVLVCFAAYALLLNVLYHLAAFWATYGITARLEKKMR